jgi:hypothetical protein
MEHCATGNEIGFRSVFRACAASQSEESTQAWTVDQKFRRRSAEEGADLILSLCELFGRTFCAVFGISVLETRCFAVEV